jgi:hypothetical protein
MLNKIKTLNFGLLSLTVIVAQSALCQVGIGTNTPHQSAQLELSSTNKGFLPTRIALTSLTDVTTIPSPASGLLIYNTATAGTSPDDVVPGYYYFDGSKWMKIIVNIPNLSLNDLSDATTDSNKVNFSLGSGSLSSLTPSSIVWEGTQNLAIGYNSLKKNTTGRDNHAIGHYSMLFNTTGRGNLAIGLYGLYTNKTGNDNIAIGTETMSMSENSMGTIAIGKTTAIGGGNYNVSIGNGAGPWGGFTEFSVGVGSQSLSGYANGIGITAIGAFTEFKWPGPSNFRNATAIGYKAKIMASNTIQLGNDSITDVMTSGKMRARGYLTSATSLTSATDVTTIASPDTGLMVYNTATAGSSLNNVSPGYYYFNGSKWVSLSGISKLDDLTEAVHNSFNLGIGSGALLNSSYTTTYDLNSYPMDEKGGNIAVGNRALESSTSAGGNVAIGDRSLFRNTTGSNNTATGTNSLFKNTTGSSNTAVGNQALFGCTTCSGNVAIGDQSLHYQPGNNNTAVGIAAGAAMGGNNNTALGANSGGWGGELNTSVGYGSFSGEMSFGQKNTFIGANATVPMDGTVSGSTINSTAIGYGALIRASNTIQLGNSEVTNVYTSGNITANSVQLTSDARLKTNIEGIEGGLETLLRLRPYSYQKRSGFEPGYHEEKEYGFLAQDIREILPELVKEGNDPDKALTVNYTALIPILTKAIQEQQKEIDELKALLKNNNGNTRKKNRKS